MLGFDADGFVPSFPAGAKGGIAVAEVDLFLVPAPSNERARHFVEYGTYADVTD